MILTATTLFFRDEASSVFWAVGMAITAIVCVIAAAIVAVRLHFERRRRHRREAIAEKWREILRATRPMRPDRAHLRRRLITGLSYCFGHALMTCGCHPIGMS